MKNEQMQMKMQQNFLEMQLAHPPVHGINHLKIDEKGNLSMETSERQKELAGKNKGENSYSPLNKRINQDQTERDGRAIRSQGEIGYPVNLNQGIFGTAYAKKSAMAGNVRLDSVNGRYWDNWLPGDTWDDEVYYRGESYYNGDDYRDSMVYYSIYGPDPEDIYKNSKYEYFYGADNSLDSMIYYYWTGTEWYPDTKYGLAYDAFGNQILMNYSYWNGTDWEPNYQYESDYDTDGNQTLRINYYWNGADWYPNSKYEYAYDGNGNQTLYARWYWNGSVWYGSNKRTYTYNDQDQQLEYIYYNWNSGLTDWMPSSKYIYEYNC